MIQCSHSVWVTDRKPQETRWSSSLSPDNSCFVFIYNRSPSSFVFLFSCFQSVSPKGPSNKLYKHNIDILSWLTCSQTIIMSQTIPLSSVALFFLSSAALTSYLEFCHPDSRGPSTNFFRSPFPVSNVTIHANIMDCFTSFQTASGLFQFICSV